MSLCVRLISTASSLLHVHYRMDLLPSAIEENGDHWSSEDVGRGLQDWLICIGEANR